MPRSWNRSAKSTDSTSTKTTLPNLVQFGSWIGGDRDGNPLVKPDCIRDALEMARAPDPSRVSLRRRIAERPPEFFTPPNRRSPTTCSRALQHYERTIPGVHLAWGPHNQAESYRRFLSYMFHRLQQSRDAKDSLARLRNAAEFEEDLLLVRDSLQRKSWRTAGPNLRRARCCAKCEPSAFTCTRSTSASTRAYTREVLQELGPEFDKQPKLA